MKKSHSKVSQCVWAIFFIFSLFFSKITAADDYASNVIVANDFSNSYYLKERFPIIEKNFDKLSRAMTSRSSGLRHPTLFQVIPIDEASQSKGTMCEFTIQEKKLVSREDPCDGESDCSANPKDAATYIEDICSKTVIKRGEGGATDIEGALSLAGQLAESQDADRKFLFIFSDMEEYRFDEVKSTPINLSGFEIMVVCSGSLLEKSGFCMSKRGAWTEKLKSFGADSVQFVIESSRWNRVAMDLFE